MATQITLARWPIPALSACRRMALLACCLATGLIHIPSAYAEDIKACRARHDELARQAEHFTGDAQMKRLIDADLARAMKEAAEGDEEECSEALDHAAKLLTGRL